MRFFLSKRFWQRVAICLVSLVAVGLIVNGILAWRADSQLQAKVTEIRAAGDPASIAELAPEPVPDDENAAVILERIAPRVDAFSKDYAGFSNSPFGMKYDEAEDRGEPATKDQIDAIRVILSKYPDVQQAIAEAAQCDKYASRLDYSLDTSAFIDALVKHQSRIRTVARFLEWQATVLLADGQNEEALQSGIRIYRLAWLYENEPTLVSYLVAIAVRGLAAAPIYDALSAGPVSPEVLVSLDAELARHDDPAPLLRTLKTERALSAGWSGPMLGMSQMWLANTFGWALKSYQAGAIDYANQMLPMAERSWFEVRDKFGPADSPLPTGHGVLADLLTPAMRAVFQAHARSQVLMRALRIRIALRQFAEKSGREANGLAELELPKKSTIDPNSGQPLKLKQSDEGWVIYSVMENGQDDDGDFKGLKDYGVAPPKLRVTE
jgi:hypothetical protein